MRQFDEISSLEPGASREVRVMANSLMQRYVTEAASDTKSLSLLTQQVKIHVNFKGSLDPFKFDIQTSKGTFAVRYGVPLLLLCEESNDSATVC